MSNFQFSKTADHHFIVSSDNDSSTSNAQSNDNFSVGVIKPYRVVEKHAEEFATGNLGHEEVEKPIDVEVQEAISKYNYSMFS